jgi:hypothetical protein
MIVSSWSLNLAYLTLVIVVILILVTLFAAFFATNKLSFWLQIFGTFDYVWFLSDDDLARLFSNNDGLWSRRIISNDYRLKLWAREEICRFRVSVNGIRTSDWRSIDLDVVFVFINPYLNGFMRWRV